MAREKAGLLKSGWFWGKGKALLAKEAVNFD
jgi:hypothetical protein